MPAGDSTVIDAVVKQITEEMGEIDTIIANAGTCHHVDAEVRPSIRTDGNAAAKRGLTVILQQTTDSQSGWKIATASFILSDSVFG